MSTHRIRLGVIALGSAATLTAGVVSAGATTSSAATPASLSSIQAKAAAAITTRVDDLNRAVAKVNGDKSFGADQGTLDAYLQRDLAPLGALGTKIAADTTVTQAAADTQSIFTDYRVLALVLPAARQAADADAITVTAIPVLNALSAKAQSYVTSANQATLQPMITTLNTDISGATTAASGLASTLLGYVPSQWNANHTLLSPSKATLQTANGDVKNARDEALQIRQYLKSTHPAAVTPTTPTTAG
jgi:hypothetical protein